MLGPVLTLDDDIGGRQGGLDIAPLNVPVDQDVALVMHERRLSQQRSFRSEHARKFLVFDLDELGGVVGDLLGLARDKGNRFPGVAHAIAGEDRHSNSQLPQAARGPLEEPVRGDVLGSENSRDTAEGCALSVWIETIRADDTVARTTRAYNMPGISQSAA